jgi:hypothetical protein
VPASAVADAIIAAVEKGRAETYVPGWLRIATIVKAFAPGLYNLGTKSIVRDARKR